MTSLVSAFARAYHYMNNDTWVFADPLAEAMLKAAPVVILDEATAYTDPENENDLMKAIQALTEEKTVIMIAHRLKTVEHADQILVIDHGKIVQQGIHENLMKEEGIYRSFISERREASSWKVRKY